MTTTQSEAFRIAKGALDSLYKAACKNGEQTEYEAEMRDAEFETVLHYLSTPLSAVAGEPVKGPPWKFDRYINGQLMAEGVQIDISRDLQSACIKAAELASRGKNGEVPVLVLTSPAGLPSREEVQKIRDMIYGMARCANDQHTKGWEDFRNTLDGKLADLLRTGGGE